MTYTIEILSFILGAHIGSFLNVCIWRLPRGESVVNPPSHCPKCDTRLQPLDLVPILSQTFLRARCRYCGAKISWRYAGIECLTGILFALVAASVADKAGVVDFQSPWLWIHLIQGWLMVATLIVIFWIDYETRLIQLEAVFLLGLTGLVVDVWELARHEKALDQTAELGRFALPAPVPESILAMVVTALGLWMVRELFSRLYGKEALGFGDVILVAAITANLGWHATIFTFFFLSIILGASIGVLLQIPRAVRSFVWARRRNHPRANALARHAFRKAIPFGPMLAIGAMVAWLYGQNLNTAYMNAVNPPQNTIMYTTPQ